MAQHLYFARETKLYVKIGSDVWEVPVLDGFSFAQATTASEIVLSEMENASGVSRRGKRVFNDALAPAEWSFSTYSRPFMSAAGGGTDADAVARVHAVEEVMWALLAGQAVYDAANYHFEDGSDNAYFNWSTTTTSNDTLTIDWSTSQKSTLGTASLIFKVGSGAGVKYYEIAESVCNEATIDFDIDGIAMVNWSGFGSVIQETTAPTVTVSEAITSTNNFIRNRLTQLTIAPNKTADIGGATAVAGGAWTTESLTVTDGGSGYTDGAGQTYNIPGGNGDAVVTYTVVGGAVTTASITTAGTGYTDGETDVQFPASGNYTVAQSNLMEDNYLITLTGGNITISNNITFITPEELGFVNFPIGHVTGNRSFSGNFTCYLDWDDGTGGDSDKQSADFWQDMTALTDVVTHSFNLSFAIGGTAEPRMTVYMPKSHVEIPTHSIEDVISLETNFTGLGTTIDSTDEATVEYVMQAVGN